MRTLRHRIDREKEKISQIMNAIQSLSEPPAESGARPGQQSNIRALRLVSNEPAAAKRPDSEE